MVAVGSAAGCYILRPDCWDAKGARLRSAMQMHEGLGDKNWEFYRRAFAAATTEEEGKWQPQRKERRSNERKRG